MRFEERHRLDAVAVGIADEGGVIAFAMLGSQPRRTVGRATGRKRCGMERIDQFNRAHAQRCVRATIGYYMAALTRRDALIATLERFFGGWDALICPVTVSPAIGHVPFGTPIDVDQHKVPYFIAGTGYTCPFNLTGNPSVVVPFARSKDGMPIGVQLVGKRWSEPELLALAQKVSLITGPYTPPPNYKQ